MNLIANWRRRRLPTWVCKQKRNYGVIGVVKAITTTETERFHFPYALHSIFNDWMRVSISISIFPFKTLDSTFNKINLRIFSHFLFGKCLIFHNTFFDWWPNLFGFQLSSNLSTRTSNRNFYRLEPLSIIASFRK